MNWLLILMLAVFAFHIVMLVDGTEHTIETQEYEHYRVRP